jgi:hypothetical protein
MLPEWKLTKEAVLAQKKHLVIYMEKLNLASEGESQ